MTREVEMVKLDMDCKLTLVVKADLLLEHIKSARVCYDSSFDLRDLYFLMECEREYQGFLSALSVLGINLSVVDGIHVIDINGEPV